MHDSELWRLAQDEQLIEPEKLMAAIERQCLQQTQHDYRTRLLIREAMHALHAACGPELLLEWVLASDARAQIEAIMKEEFKESGFPSLPLRVMRATRPDTVRQFLRELASDLGQPTRVVIGGSVALMLANYLVRRTEDIDIVDEVPAEIRAMQQRLDSMSSRYGLHLTHAKSSYLPSGWQNRTQSEGDYGQLEVYLVDAIDIFVAKLFSRREKDTDDLRVLATRLEMADIEDRLRVSAASLLAENRISRQQARRNWYIVYGEELPSV